MAKPVPVAAIAQLLNLTERRIQQLVKDNILPRPVKGYYEPVHCVHAYIEYLKKQISGSGEISLTDERTRLTKYQADLAEIELQKARGEMIPSKRAMSAWGGVVQNVRQKLLVIPSRLAPVLTGIKSIPQMKEKLEESIYEVLNECTNPDLLKLGRSEYHPAGIGLFPPAPETEGERVGGPEEKTEPGVERGTGPVADEEGGVPEGDDGCL
jgi:phage terminase Nu1 subunit (DNA packaging protein)